MSAGRRGIAALLLVAACAVASPAAAATITIVNLDSPGEGFNDNTPVAPVGGNPGTTRGQQRLFVFQTAASIWGAILPSAIEIRVNANFNPLTCDATSAVLGGANTTSNRRDFTGAEVAGTWYPVALANRLAGVDLVPASNDITTQFNSTLDGGTCLGGTTWYYGVDGNEGNQVELLPVVIHELGHGLGFAATTSLATGGLLSGFPNIYERNLFGITANKQWPAMTGTERLNAAIDTGKLVWTGYAVNTVAPTVLGPRTDFQIDSPPSIAGIKLFGNAEFGPDPSAATVTGELVLVDDDVAPDADACESLVNGASVAGKIAVMDRGLCPFVDKAANAFVEGAIAVVIVNNVAGAPPAMGGDFPGLTIPVISITQADGNAIKAEMLNGPVLATLGPNGSFIAGCDDLGRPRLYTPNPLEQGSSVSHFDTSAEPSLLMEPFITDGLSSGVDLTRFAFEDIGWFNPRTTDTVGPAPARFALLGARPNPFRATTSLAYELPSAGHVELAVFDVAGRRVKALLDAELPAGLHATSWDGTDDAGVRVAPGVYFYRVTTPAGTGTRTAVLVQDR